MVYLEINILHEKKLKKEGISFIKIEQQLFIEKDTLVKNYDSIN